MLKLSQALLGQPIMSLRTGGNIATATTAIINPNNLKVEGFYCQDRFDKKQSLILIYSDIRDIIPQGIVVNDHEVLAHPSELVRLKDILKINFQLIGKPVYSSSGNKIGKVSDFAAETETMFVQKLYVSRSILKDFAGGSLSVDRSQIIEITNRKIVIQDPLQGIKVEDAQPTIAPVAPAT